MNRVLILGGYGGFGARLSRRLVADGWTVIVAGRNLETARTFAATLDGAEPARADREQDLAPVLLETKPDLLIDCAGPFQGNSYAVPEACIAAGVHYCDLADAREFVCGVGALDGAAREAGVTVRSGGSTVPALTSAVVRHLVAEAGMKRVDMIDIALGASTAATGGHSIARAVLSYAGKPINIWRGHRWQTVHGVHGLQPRCFRTRNGKPIVRWVAFADVPDLQLIPDEYADRPASVFRAGNESALQMTFARFLAGLVRRGWIGSLSKWDRVLIPIQQFMARFGSARSAMSVEVFGRDAGSLIRSGWTVVAGNGEGPEIPVLAAQLFARRLRSGSLPAGACDMSRQFDYHEFAALLADIDTKVEAECDRSAPMYRHIMGEQFDHLPAPLRSMHAIAGHGVASGSATVERGTSILARLAGAFAGFPPAGEYPLYVDFDERDGVQTWTRHFGPHRFHSYLSRAGERIQERFGPSRFRFALPSDQNGLQMVLRSWSVFHVPLPLFLAPRIVASERADGEDFLFDVDVALPLAGPVVRYRGRLRRL